MGVQVYNTRRQCEPCRIDCPCCFTHDLSNRCEPAIADRNISRNRIITESIHDIRVSNHQVMHVQGFPS
jgi:hypothetical protein